MAVKSVLVTGGTGLIGSHLSGRLAQDGYDVTVLGRSSRFAVPEAVPDELRSKVCVVSAAPGDFEVLEEQVKNADVIFHKAVSIGMAGSVESARDYVGANMADTAGLIDALRSSGSRVKKVILGSSVSVYGEGVYSCGKCGKVRPQPRSVIHPVSNPVRWDPSCPNCGADIKPVTTPEASDRHGESIYAVTKKAQEDLLCGVCRQLNIPLSVLRYSTVLGPGQSWHNPITRVLELLSGDKQPTLHEDGLQTREFVFIEDVVEANMQAMLKQDQAIDFFNVSTVRMTLLDFTNALAKAMANSLKTKPIEPVVDGRLTAGDVRHCWVDCSKLEEKFGFRAHRQSQEGIQSLTDWFVRYKGLTSRSVSG
ncbi:MAG TPA: NAD(P)-dependent oxidoreductase [Planktothrix sp.]